MKNLLQHKSLIWTICLYVIFQLLSLVMLQTLFLLSSLLAYVISIVLSIVVFFRSTQQRTVFSNLLGVILLYFLANLILFLVYLPVFVLNPEINWTLKNGGVESDPMILYAYVPPIFLVCAVGILLISSFVVFFCLKKGHHTNVEEFL